MIFKKIAAAITAYAMAVTGLAVSSSANANFPYTATLHFISENWCHDDETSIEIMGNGTYTISTDSETWIAEDDEDCANGVRVLAIDIEGLGDDLAAEGNVKELCTFSDVKVTADGADIPVDQSKLIWLYNNNNKGEVRLELYNEWNDKTKDNRSINPDDIVDIDSLSITFTLTINEDEPDEPITEPQEPHEPIDIKVGDDFFVDFDPETGEVIGEPYVFDESDPYYGYAMYRCKVLNDETISVYTYNLVNRYLYKGNSITIPGTIGGYTVTEIGDPTKENGICIGGYSSITIPDTVRTINKNAFAYNYCLEEIIFGENSQLKLIDRWAFQDCRSLSSITIPANVETIAYGAFMNTNQKHNVSLMAGNDFTGVCSLTAVNFAEGSKLKLIDQWAFQGQEALKSITLPDSLEKIGYGAFLACTALTKINVPKNVEEIGAFAFQIRGFNHEDANLSEIIVDESNPNFKSVDGVVFSKDGKTIVAYPVAKSSKYDIPADVSKIAEAAFGNCHKLTAVLIPEGVTNIPENAFSYCTSLAEVKLPSTLKTIGKWGFEATAMTSIDIPESVTAIDAHAFESSSLKNINGVAGSYAETFAKENGYSFNSIPTADTENTFTDNSEDKAADIEVIAKPDVIPEEAYFSVRLDDSLTNDEQIAYNCYFTYNGAEYEPTDKVTVKIPIPVSMRDIADTLKVYHYQDGKYVAMEVTVEDGYLVFETDHFSIYVVTAKELETKDDSNNTETPEDTKAPTDTEAPSNSDNEGNPDTGAAAVTMVTAAAVIASAAVMVISKKRK